jgi:hypothetical protein
MKTLRSVCWFAFSAAFFSLCSLSLSAQGFGGLGGMKKAKETTLKRLLPATVNLNQKRIKVIAEPVSNKIDSELVTILRTKLVTLVQKDNRFILDDRNPETLLKFTITIYYVESRVASVPGANPPQNCTMFTGKIESSYQAIEVGTDAPLDSENLEYAITTDGPKGVSGPSKLNLFGGRHGSCGTEAKATANEARDELADSIVKQMAQRAAPSEQPIGVLLPGGKLEALSALAMSQRWSTLLEQAEKTDPLPKPDDDAYRIYLIALANEALAYQDARDAAELEKARRSDVSSDAAKKSMAQEEKYFTDAQAYIDKAAKLYKDAIQAKSGEKEFRVPDARMEEAVKLYATIARHKVEYQEAVLKKQQERASGTATVSDTRGAGPGPKAAVTSPFNMLIGMCQDHEKDIAQMIKDHPAELHFEKGLSFEEDRKMRKECGDDSKEIGTAIKAQTATAPKTGKLN